MNGLVRILLVDDHQVVRQGLRSMLSSMPDIQVVAEATGGAEALSILARDPVDVMLLDIRLDDMSGIDVATSVRRMASPPRIVMLSINDDRFSVEQAFAAGASGYLLKNVSRPELLSAIRRVNAGERVVSPALVPLLIPMTGIESATAAEHLTKEDVDLLRMVAAGATNLEISIRISLSEASVKRRLQRLYTLLNVTSRVEAVRVAGREGYI